MCNLCNGTHVLHDTDGPVFGFYTCPNCGPVPKKQLEKEYAEFRKRIYAAELKFLKGKSQESSETSMKIRNCWRCRNEH